MVIAETLYDERTNIHVTRTVDLFSYIMEFLLIYFSKHLS